MMTSQNWSVQTNRFSKGETQGLTFFVTGVHTMKLSIIVPTYNESLNVIALTEAIKATLKDDVPYEIVFVDDSTDNTPEVLNSLAQSIAEVRYEHRVHERGLGTAVVRGFELATGDVLTVMDADLQHPPELLLRMLHEINAGADVVIPSRFIPGGDDGGLAVHRKIVSAVARYMGKLALKSIRKINDPTSGYFMFRKEVIQGKTLKPIGWKILIEVLVRGAAHRVVEIPYEFHPRNAGESKMSLTEQWNYLRHLFKLVVESPEDRRFYLFAMVGVSGVLVNMLVYDVLVRLGMPVTLSGALSGLVAMMSNFILNDRLTWMEARSGSLKLRATRYVFTSLIGIGINVGVLAILYHGLHVHYLLSNLIGIAIATVFNYLVNNSWTWKQPSEPVTIVTKPGQKRASAAKP